jgi:small subunit ribosomal protein S9
MGGKGVVTINDLPADEYFNGNEAFAYELLEPLRLLQKTDSFDISLKIDGGGHHSQVGASKLAIAKALSLISDDIRTTLKKAGLLKRDPREKERMKPGLKGARRKEQFSKR